MLIKQRVFYYDKILKEWTVRTDENTLLHTIAQEIKLYRQVIIPYRWNRLVDRISGNY